jgi:hypothetical protein
VLVPQSPIVPNSFSHFSFFIIYIFLFKKAVFNNKFYFVCLQGVLQQQASERLVLPSAALLAGLGLAVSTFSLKQLLASHRPAVHSN